MTCPSRRQWELEAHTCEYVFCESYWLATPIHLVAISERLFVLSRSLISDPSFRHQWPNIRLVVISDNLSVLLVAISDKRSVLSPTVTEYPSCRHQWANIRLIVSERLSNLSSSVISYPSCRHQWAAIRLSFQPPHFCGGIYGCMLLNKFLLPMLRGLDNIRANL